MSYFLIVNICANKSGLIKVILSFAPTWMNLESTDTDRERKILHNLVYM